MRKPAVRVTANRERTRFSIYHWSEYVTYRDSEEEAKAFADELQKKIDRERFQREEKARQRRESHIALCGINVYFGGWMECHKCGQPLTYYDTMREASSTSATALVSKYALHRHLPMERPYRPHGMLWSNQRRGSPSLSPRQSPRPSHPLQPRSNAASEPPTPIAGATYETRLGISTKHVGERPGTRQEIH